MEKLNTLQEVIEKRAKDRAEKEVRKLLDFIQSSDIKGAKVWSDANIIIDGKREPLRNAFWGTSGELIQAIIKELTEKYIPVEVEKFVKDVENLKDSVDSLYLETQDF